MYESFTDGYIPPMADIAKTYRRDVCLVCSYEGICC